MYKLISMNGEVFGAYKEIDGVRTSFTFSDPANTDYANFKKDLANGAELQDADGTVIDGIAYLEELV
jgi:uncharacterized lipoprotein YehR (DUF1307 family)